MAVLKTTSPRAESVAPQPRPCRMVPSARASTPVTPGRSWVFMATSVAPKTGEQTAAWLGVAPRRVNARARLSQKRQPGQAGDDEKAGRRQDVAGRGGGHRRRGEQEAGDGDDPDPRASRHAEQGRRA